MPTPSETPEFNERYSRQTRFAPFGAQGQHNLEHTCISHGCGCPWQSYS